MPRNLPFSAFFFVSAATAAALSNPGTHSSRPLLPVTIHFLSLYLSSALILTISNEPSGFITGASLEKGPNCPPSPFLRVFSRTSRAFASAFSFDRASKPRISSLSSGTAVATGVGASTAPLGASGAGAAGLTVLTCSAQAPSGVRLAQTKVSSNRCGCLSAGEVGVHSRLGVAGMGRGWGAVGVGRGLLAHRICILGAALRSTGWHRHAVRLPGRDA
eukprot:scaffold54524_cov64-Phaeocystis_antarctica.AAC.2